MIIVEKLDFAGRVLLGGLSMCCFINDTRFLLKVKTIVHLNVEKEMPRKQII